MGWMVSQCQMTYGTLLENAVQTAEILAGSGIEATVLRLADLSDLNIGQIVSKTVGNKLFVLEEVSGGTGISGELALKLSQAHPDIQVFFRDLGDRFIPHGSVNKLYEHCGLDAKSIAEYIQEVLN